MVAWVGNPRPNFASVRNPNSSNPKSSILTHAINFLHTNFQPSYFKVSNGGQIPNCNEIGSQNECESKSKCCKRCSSNTVDDMCFGSQKAWWLPCQRNAIDEKFKVKEEQEASKARLSLMAKEFPLLCCF